MNRRKQVKCLEEKAEQKAPEAREEPDTSEEWLKILEAFERKGYFKAEPDFARALAEFRAALREAQSSIDPPWDAPADFMPTGTPQRWRLQYRQELQRRFAKLNQARAWCRNILSRIADGIAPLTEAEYTMLVEWVKLNKTRLRALTKDDSEEIALGNGEICKLWRLHWLQNAGFKGSETGVLMEAARKVKALLEGKASSGAGGEIGLSPS